MLNFQNESVSTLSSLSIPIASKGNGQHMPESTLVRPPFPAAPQKFPTPGLQDIIRCHCCGEMQQFQHHHQMVAFNGALTPHLPFQDSLATARFAQPYFENHVQARFRMPPHNDGYLHPAHHMLPRSGRCITQFDSFSNSIKSSDKRGGVFNYAIKGCVSFQFTHLARWYLVLV